jgi:hypothetical protein
MIEMVLLVFLLPPPPPPELRHPVVRAATATAMADARTADLIRICTPSDRSLVSTAARAATHR